MLVYGMFMKICPNSIFVLLFKSKYINHWDLDKKNKTRIKRIRIILVMNGMKIKLVTLSFYIPYVTKN